MRIRLHGTPEEIDYVLTRLRQVLTIDQPSRPCRDRSPSRLSRVYLQVELGGSERRCPPAPVR